MTMHPCNAVVNRSCRTGRHLLAQHCRNFRLAAHNKPCSSSSIPSCNNSLQHVHRIQAAAAAISPGLDKLQQQCPSVGGWAQRSSSRSRVTANAAAAAAAQQQQEAVVGVQQLRNQLQLYNTMSRRKEHFRPRPEMGNKVQMYVCGVTVYDFSHIGKGRPAAGGWAGKRKHSHALHTRSLPAHLILHDLPKLAPCLPAKGSSW